MKHDRGYRGGPGPFDGFYSPCDWLLWVLRDGQAKMEADKAAEEAKHEARQ